MAPHRWEKASHPAGGTLLPASQCPLCRARCLNVTFRQQSHCLGVTTTTSPRTQASHRTWLVYSAERVPGVVFSGLETGLTEIEVITVPALEPGPVDGEHLAAVAPAWRTAVSS